MWRRRSRSRYKQRERVGGEREEGPLCAENREGRVRERERGKGGTKFAPVEPWGLGMEDQGG